MRHFLFLILFFGISLSTAAQNSTSNVFRFLETSPNARSSALGGNHVALFNGDFSLLYLNPAYLNANDEGRVSATYMNYLGEANTGFTNSVFNLEKLGTVGIGIRFVSYGEFDHLDENGEAFGTFHPNDIAITGAYSLEIAEKLRAGAGIDLIHSSYANYKSSAVAVNGGLFYQDNESRVSAGISIRNLGAQITAFDERREPLPLDISAGISKKPEGFPFHLNLTFKQLNNWDMRIFGERNRPDFLNNLFRHILFGGEASFTENFHLRLGYDHFLHEQTSTGGNFDLAGIAFGVGFNVKTLQIDISRNSYSKLGGITQISIQTQVF